MDGSFTRVKWMGHTSMYQFVAWLSIRNCHSVVKYLLFSKISRTLSSLIFMEEY